MKDPKKIERRKGNFLADTEGKERSPGIDPKTGEYSTLQMMLDEMYGGDTDQPLFD